MMDVEHVDLEAMQRQSRVLEEQVDDFGKLDHLLRLFSSSMPIEEVLQSFLKGILRLCNAHEGSIILFAPSDQKEAKTLLHHPMKKGKLDPAFHQLLAEWLAQHQRLLLTQDVVAAFDLKNGEKKYQPIASLLSVPIEWQGRMAGAITLLSLRAGQRFGDRELRLLSLLQKPCAQFIAFTKLHEKLFTEPLRLHAQSNGRVACFGNMNSKSAKMQEVFALLERVIPTDGRVLLEGESGTGKELIARAIHFGGPRKDSPFVAVDCGALPANLLESELFGYVKGAFTGADRDKNGLFEEANGGTLFLDEIANMPVEVQSKLLRAIQEQEIRPLGSAQTQKVDVRIIAAASSDLRALVEAEKFRKDLFYRLNVVSVYLPPLRERKEDVRLLAEHFLAKLAEKYGKQLKSFKAEAVAYLEAYSWPGNIRELENVVERMVILAAPQLEHVPLELLPPEVRPWVVDKVNSQLPESAAHDLKAMKETYEKMLVLEALAKHGWNQCAAAKALGTSERNVRYMIKKFGLKRA